MKNLELKQLGIQELDAPAMKDVKGIITLQGFADTIHWLLDNGHWEQSQILMGRYRRG